MVTDPIADFLTRIRNAQMAGHRIVEIPASNLKKRITEILYNQGYILKYKFEDDSKQGVIKIALKYDVQTKQPAIHSLERISRPGLRTYARPDEFKHAFINTHNKGSLLLHSVLSLLCQSSHLLM